MKKVLPNTVLYTFLYDDYTVKKTRLRFRTSLCLIFRLLKIELSIGFHLLLIYRGIKEKVMLNDHEDGVGVSSKKDDSRCIMISATAL